MKIVLKYNQWSGTLLLFILSLALASCGKLRNEGVRSDFSDAKKIEITLNVGDLTNGTRVQEEDGKDDFNENKIERLDIFFFALDNGKLVKQFKASDGLTFEQMEEGCKATLSVPNTETTTYEEKNFKIVAVANSEDATLSGIRSLTDLEEKVVTSEFNNDQKQSCFLMDGSGESSTITWDPNVLYSVPNPIELKRAAAKIRLKIKDINVKVHENGHDVVYVMDGSPQVKLQHFTQKGKLVKGDAYQPGEGEWVYGNYRSMVNSRGPEDNKYSLSVPFYCYENNWTDSPEKRTYLMLKIAFKAEIGKESDGVIPKYGDPKYYFYKIPISPRMAKPSMSEQDKEKLFKIERNHIYDITSSIQKLGSEDEGEPVDITSNVAIEPWKENEKIDGDINNLHYLVVLEHFPTMPNQSEREVGFRSDLPVKISIDKTRYEFYDSDGNYIEIIETSDFGELSVEPKQEGEKKILIKNPVPTNFVPLEIFFTVTHILPSDETGTPLSQKVKVTQYPPKYVTGTKSPGYKPNENDSGPYADFRFHDMLGSSKDFDSLGNCILPQKNNVFYKVTTIVNQGEEIIGDPTDEDGRTRTDVESNKIVSPEFIIASQHGLSVRVYQTGSSPYIYGKKEGLFVSGYGPLERHDFDQNIEPYSSGKLEVPMSYDEYYKRNYYMDNYISYVSAEDRCYNYFEGEYGIDGDYDEWYVNEDGDYVSRRVNKVFKYKGRWRLPTAAEIAYVDAIQDNPTSAVKYVLEGSDYWTAQSGYSYRFKKDELHFNKETAFVRCVFDTYKVKENK